MGNTSFALFMDQLIIHKMNSLLDLYAFHNILHILNAPAVPDLNAIELCFS